jgi:hypothetical protein
MVELAELVELIGEREEGQEGRWVGGSCSPGAAGGGNGRKSGGRRNDSEVSLKSPKGKDIIFLINEWKTSMSNDCGICIYL